MLALKVRKEFKVSADQWDPKGDADKQDNEDYLDKRAALDLQELRKFIILSYVFFHLKLAFSGPRGLPGFGNVEIGFDPEENVIF